MTALKLVALTIFYAILSWVMIHLLAVLGVFIALAYPIWWAVLPQGTFCFYCKSLKQGMWCRFCKKTVDPNDPVYPHVSNLRSAVLNGILIFLFTVLSITLVYGESKLLNKLGIPHTAKTVYFVIPAKGQYRLGEIFPMKIELVGVKTPINAIQADVSFDP
ncbi:MAG: hypothetical protein WC243_04705, partial [Patescibacteria group bacterium]